MFYKMMHRPRAGQSLILLGLIVVALVSPNPSPARAGPVGPYMVKDLNPHGSSSPWNLTAWNHQLIFEVFHHGTRKDQLWRSDGTAAGTLLLHSFDLAFSNPIPFVAAGKYLYFAADDRVLGVEPWRTDGTPDGTRMIRELVPGKGNSAVAFFGGAGHKAFFELGQGVFAEMSLWRTNGKKNGTRPLSTVLANATPGSAAAIGKALLFAASDGVPGPTGNELWKSDGTPEGTMLVKDINPSGDSSPRYLSARDGEIWFFAKDGSSTYGLWQSDGSEQGTQLIQAIGDSSKRFTVAAEMVQHTLFFVIRNDETGRFELWVSDGTGQGTNLIHDIGSSDNNIPILEAVGNTLFFAAAGETYKLNLWKSDGTSQGTVKVADTEIVDTMASVGDILYFPNVDQVGDIELWQSDGTPDRTVRVANINRHGSASPRWLTRVGKTLFFTADDGTHGEELWAYEP